MFISLILTRSTGLVNKRLWPMLSDYEISRKLLITLLVIGLPSPPSGTTDQMLSLIHI